MEDSIKAMEQVFAASVEKLADSIGVLHVDASKYGGGWSIKPGYLSDKGYVGVKLGCGYPGNFSKGIPTTARSTPARRSRSCCRFIPWVVPPLREVRDDVSQHSAGR